MKYIYLLLISFTLFSTIGKVEPLEVCIKYKFNKMKEKNSELILRNIINDQFFKILKKKHPTIELTWSEIWTAAHGIFVDENNVQKTYLKACVAKVGELQNSATVALVMKTTASHFQKAFNFYFDNVSKLDMDKAIDMFKNELDKPETGVLLNSIKEHNK